MKKVVDKCKFDDNRKVKLVTTKHGRNVEETMKT